MKQCKATHSTRPGINLRCELPAGHESVHFDGHKWWPNKDGLPVQHKTPPAMVFLMLALAAIALLLGVLLLIR